MSNPDDEPLRDEALLRDVSTVVPVAAEDSSWRDLLPDLASLSRRAEIVLVGTQPAPRELNSLVEAGRLTCPVRWIVAQPGRAGQLNAGARAASHRYLWFLHADSRVTRAAVEALERSLRSDGGALHFFNLAFRTDGPRWMWLNAIGVRFRSHVLGIPFGDQGLCLERGLFESLGGYDERAAYGEDHLLVWAARRRGIPLRSTGASISTSARKYRRHGWFRTTARHLRLTARQALPELAALVGERLRAVRSGTPGAIAVFVKTPGLSPIKTRLAETVGRQAAEEFHRLSAAAVEAVVAAAAPELAARGFWAVAEKDALSDPRWFRFATIWQGTGGLGERLGEVYDTLIARHRFVIFLGADAPQITTDILNAAAASLQTGEAAGPRFVLGRSRDGGFYLFGGTGPIPRALWRGVAYSARNTADELARRLERLGPVAELPPLSDVDTADDVASVESELGALAGPLPAQRAVLAWARSCGPAENAT